MIDQTTACIFAFCAAIGAATFSIIIRMGQRYANATSGVVIGLIVSVPFLLALVLIFSDLRLIDRTAVLCFFVSGLLGPCLGRLFIFYGIHHLGVSRAVPLKSVQPLVAAIMAYMVLGERPSPLIWIGTIMIVGGCALFSIKKSGDLSWDRRYIWLPMAAVFSFAAGAIVRKIGLSILFSPLIGVTITTISGLIFILSFSFALPKNYRPNLAWGKAWYYYGICGLVNTGTFILSFHAVMRGDISITQPIASTSPFFALILSHLLLRDVEKVTLPIVVGTFLTVGGALLVSWKFF
tara:strand:+ start:4677 stop:5558 length:882 start_codon:yes stop_codon:yes gene_type:complete